MSATAERTRTAAPRVLVVDDEPEMLELIDDVVGRQGEARMLHAGSIAEAERILASHSVELMVADVKLPDGDGSQLLAALRSRQPQARAILMTGAPSVEGAVAAIRHGAADFLAKPFSADHLAERVGRALKIQAEAAKVEKRLVRLRDALRRLNESRKLVSRKVDLLCNDLVTAYGEVSRELNDVRLHESFRNHLAQAKDLEQMLCHAMDWLLREIGYMNIAIWLNADEHQMHLGAYMKYTLPGEDDLIEAMRQGLLPLVEQDGLLDMDGGAARRRLPVDVLQHMEGQSVLASVCSYLSEPLGMIVLFRDEQTGFSAEHASLLQCAAPIFAVALASMVRSPGDSENPRPAHSDGEADSDADWWKRGEAPPF
jgi:FixJ family two-component response regulator